MIAVNGFLSCPGLGPPLPFPGLAPGTVLEPAETPLQPHNRVHVRKSPWPHSAQKADSQRHITAGARHHPQKPRGSQHCPERGHSTGREARDTGNSEPRVKQTPLLEMLSLATYAPRTGHGWASRCTGPPAGYVWSQRQGRAVHKPWSPPSSGTGRVTGSGGQFTGRRVGVGSCLPTPYGGLHKSQHREKPLHWVLQRCATSHVCSGY